MTHSRHSHANGNLRNEAEEYKDSRFRGNDGRGSGNDREEIASHRASHGLAKTVSLRGNAMTHSRHSHANGNLIEYADECNPEVIT